MYLHTQGGACYVVVGLYSLLSLCFTHDAAISASRAGPWTVDQVNQIPWAKHATRYETTIVFLRIINGRKCKRFSTYRSQFSSYNEICRPCCLNTPLRQHANLLHLDLQIGPKWGPQMIAESVYKANYGFRPLQR